MPRKPSPPSRVIGTRSRSRSSASVNIPFYLWDNLVFRTEEESEEEREPNGEPIIWCDFDIIVQRCENPESDAERRLDAKTDVTQAGSSPSSRSSSSGFCSQSGMANEKLVIQRIADEQIVSSEDESQEHDLLDRQMPKMKGPASKQYELCFQWAEKFVIPWKNIKKTFKSPCSTREDLFTCHYDPICVQAMETSALCQTHILEAHCNLKLFVCNVCHQSFATKQQRTDHSKEHEKEKEEEQVPCMEWDEDVRVVLERVGKADESPQEFKLRGRGRPKKKVSLLPQVVVPSLPKRGRGRPRNSETVRVHPPRPLMNPSSTFRRGENEHSDFSEDDQPSSPDLDSSANLKYTLETSHDLHMENSSDLSMADDTNVDLDISINSFNNTSFSVTYDSEFDTLNNFTTSSPINGHVPLKKVDIPHFKGNEIEKFKKASFWCREFISKYRPSSDEIERSKERAVQFEVVSADKLCIRCDKKFKLWSHFATHDPCSIVNPLLKPLACNRCSMTFEDMINLRDHIATHFKKQFKCNQERCGKLFHTHKEIEEHCLKTHNTFERFICKICASKFQEYRHCQAHILKVHCNLSPSKCNRCGAQSMDPSQVKGKKHRCGKRNKNKRKNLDLLPTEPTSSNAQENPPIAPEQVTESEPVLTNGNETQPESSNQLSASQSNLVDQRQQALDSCEKFIVKKGKKEGDADFEFTTFSETCKTCGQVFHKESLLNVHLPCYKLKYDCQSIPYKCLSCGQICDSLKELQEHVVVHYNPQYKCKSCDTVCFTHTATQKHSETGCPDKFICIYEPSKCSKESTSKVEIEKHILRDHFNYLSFNCSFCGIALDSMAAKNKHEFFEHKRHLIFVKEEKSGQNDMNEVSDEEVHN